VPAFARRYLLSWTIAQQTALQADWTIGGCLAAELVYVVVACNCVWFEAITPSLRAFAKTALVCSPAVPRLFNCGSPDIVLCGYLRAGRCLTHPRTACAWTLSFGGIYTSMAPTEIN
jgi:hypothetical protein